MSEKTKIPETTFVNEFRLNTRNWLLAIAIILVVVFLTPRIWVRIERFDAGQDYRIPYQLSRDYWLYQQRLTQKIDPNQILVLGDSVVWGEYVLPDGTLSHFLNQNSGKPNQFINIGVNGLFPLAMEGLVKYYGKPLSNKKVIVHCNVLWMSSPKADLQTAREEKFNHTTLVPQFSPRIPCYRADASDRLSISIERNSEFMSWINHLQTVYFEEKSIPRWTLQDDGADPPRYPNSYKNPLAQINLTLPAVSKDESGRGPQSTRHKAWAQNGRGVQFEWVQPETSIQWAAFRRLVEYLRSRQNEVFVVLGPFNEHMIAPESKPPYQKICSAIKEWLSQQNIPHMNPEPLPSELYADASHPLTDGYAQLAKNLLTNEAFKKWFSDN